MFVGDSALHRPVANFLQGCKFLGCQSRLATGKTWFCFESCHAINMTKDLSQSTGEKGPGCIRATRARNSGRKASPEMGNWPANIPPITSRRWHERSADMD